jgi:hypothetical protein
MSSVRLLTVSHFSHQSSPFWAACRSRVDWAPSSLLVYTFGLHECDDHHSRIDRDA